MSRYKTGGARFDPEARYKYFLATDVAYTEQISGAGIITSTLIPNMSLRIKHMNLVEKWSEIGIDLMVDSGVYSTVQNHIKKHRLTQTQGFALSPKEIDGFEQMFTDYIQLIKAIEPYVWGYVELDFGGQKNKVITRKRMQDAGVSPIPVYHPFNDDYEYFDELAEQYDRICIGNIVYSTSNERSRILHTLNVRKAKYPNLWIHLLGYTPDALLYQTTIESCDSTAWMSGMRYGTLASTGGGFNVGKMSRDYIYNRKDADTRTRQAQWSAYYGAMLEKEWKEVKKDEHK